MFADYEFYKKEYGGTKIESDAEYKYLAQQASRYIKQHTNEVNEDTKLCECAISEYLQKSTKQGNLTSETIPNFYSASWGAHDSKTVISEINSILELYLSDKYSSVGIVKLIN